MSSKLLASLCMFTHYCAERKRLMESKTSEKMNLQIQFYKCKHCGKIIVIVNDSTVPTVCCGEIMEKMIPSTMEGEGISEKHIPIIIQNRNMVRVHVGDHPHPMEESHYIQWIVLTTNMGIQKKFLCPGDEPIGEFIIKDGESIIGAYAFCNKHGLWKES